MKGAERYLIALGSNMRHVRHGRPRRVIEAALEAVEQAGIGVEAVSPIVASAPLGPSRRCYANAAAIIATTLRPEPLLHQLQAIERHFGRRPGGARWRARVLDLDIVLWSRGAWATSDLVIPHPEFRHRGFVLGPAAAIAGTWRDSVSGLTVRHLARRLSRQHPRERLTPADPLP